MAPASILVWSQGTVTSGAAVKRGTNRFRCVPSLAAVVLLVVASSANAQDGLRDRPLSVLVTLSAPRTEIQGELRTLTDQAVALVVDGVEREFPLAEVRKVERIGDPTSDGAWRGAVVLGALCFLVCQQGTSSGGEFLAVLTTNAAFGAYLGWLFDRDHVGRTSLFKAHRP